ncbi:galactose oxidase [Nitzschia inconspicua]|uniref:Galactose oxidase n=1 Tax=Nitzschia inconspicua TaxID=303405 RepID=A0A9K3KWK4_9STRA|nr:galactose oxidase [Nitzschia inconspicua]
MSELDYFRRIVLIGFAALCWIIPNVAVAQQADFTNTMTWEAKASFPGGGRHHPITFANATHGFLLTGSTAANSYMSDFWIYDADADTWTDLSNTPAAFPGDARTYGYGVASTTNCSNSKAYVGFGANAFGVRLSDLWELDMNTLIWRRLADLPGPGRRHPAMNYVEGSVNEIHVGLGDGTAGNFNDWWAYDIATDSWRQLPELPGVPRHHPFYFSIGPQSYAGLGHSSRGIERDWYRWEASTSTWVSENDFSSFAFKDENDASNSMLITTEARVAGTQFSSSGSCDSDAIVYGFVLSGDGDDHSTMATGEFHVFDPYGGVNGMGVWHELPPHPGVSRWAPGSFVLQGSTKVFFFGGYEHTQQILLDDLWMMDLAPFFDSSTNQTAPTDNVSNSSQADDVMADEAVMSARLAWTFVLALATAVFFEYSYS